MAHQSFNFQKFQGAQILIFVYENWHAASFYIKEQRQKYKFGIWLLKSTILDPWKSAFLVFEENPQIFFFFMFRLWFSFLLIRRMISLPTFEDKNLPAYLLKNNRRTNVFLVSIFENAQKKLVTIKNAILAVFGS